jgi:cysteinyl-tRNA synthetase
VNISLYNTLTRKKEPFVPLKPGSVGMYTCGPTVYQYASIGNMRAYIFADTLRRMLEYNGLKVKMVMNITDVGHLVSDSDEGEDKMLVTMRKEQKTPWEIAAHYTEVFKQDLGKLNIKPPTITCPATG